MSELGYAKGIKTWSEDDQPREKMRLKGAASLSDAELLAILLGSGSAKESALILARRILESVNNNLIELSRLTLEDLQNFKGVGLAKAVSVRSALEIGRRRELAGALDRKVIRSSSDAHALFKPILADLNHEEFWVLYLNNRNQVLGQRRISKGGLSGTTADPRQVFRIALQLHATGIILAHNHPSGNLNPSNADDQLTRNMSAGGEALIIRVLDHIVISSEGYFSYSDEGRL